MISPATRCHFAPQPGAHFLPSRDPGEVRSTWKWAQRTVLVRAARWTKVDLGWTKRKGDPQKAKMSSTHQGG